MSEIINRQIQAYRPNFLQNGNTPQGTFQNNQATQFERFKRLLEPLQDMKPKGFSICDVGSGVCDLHRFLKDNNVRHDYTGVEIVPEMVAYSKEAHPDIEMLETDILSPSFDRKFDFVVASGIFNLPGDVDRKEWEEFMYNLISKMFSLSKVGCSFNTLTTYSTFTAPELYYVKPESMISFIQTKLGRFYTLNTGYPLYETTYTIYKGDYLKKLYPSTEFTKYFS